MREVMTMPEAVDFTRISDWKLRQEVNAGRIPHFRVGRRILFRRSSLESWMSEQEEAALKNSSGGKNERLQHLL